MNAKISILFYAKRAKTSVAGLVPIYLRITIDGVRLEISSKRFVTPEKWSQEQSRMKGSSEEARSLNAYLDILKAKVHDAQKEIVQEGDLVSVDTLKNKLLGTLQKSRMLIPIFQDHNNRMEALIDKEFAQGTLTRYKTCISHTKEFLKWKFNLSDIDVRKIDYAFLNDFEFYLRTEKSCNNNSAVKYIKNFGKIIRICLANGWIERDPFVNYHSKFNEVTRQFLNEQEIEKLFTKDLRNERLSQVRDVFLFSCFTGLAYIDTQKLTQQNINLGLDGNKWIFTTRQKTKTTSNIPLLPQAEKIIEQYQTHPICINSGKLLPVLSNQKMNAYLKEIADLCGIDKELTYHIARHTFATTVTLSNGVSIESVSKMLGHKSIKTTQHYAKILDKKVSEDMVILREKLEYRKVQ
ncbi:site-specific integrase [Chryseobacterium oryctis]|uniref:Site-specific integrase n=1 Tax=Chryseobacterium oryctis TaxID=2952618 RepID=A0ABT3HNG0_9FLAO|nr:site-specific integrase [Chryseobacterium oryctis]MCW3161330.1 site-specific integrase [Chryseobacterium oryctis]